jgi:hypothetical protein
MKLAVSKDTTTETAPSTLETSENASSQKRPVTEHCFTASIFFLSCQLFRRFSTEAQ